MFIKKLTSQKIFEKRFVLHTCIYSLIKLSVLIYDKSYALSKAHTAIVYIIIKTSVLFFIIKKTLFVVCYIYVTNNMYIFYFIHNL